MLRLGSAIILLILNPALWAHITPQPHIHPEVSNYTFENQWAIFIIILVVVYIALAIIYNFKNRTKDK